MGQRQRNIWVGILLPLPADACSASPPEIGMPKKGPATEAHPLTDQWPGVACDLLSSDENEHSGFSRSPGESWDAEQTRAQHYFHIGTLFPSFSFPVFFLFPFLFLFTFCQQTPSSNELLLISYSFFPLSQSQHSTF